MRKDISHDFQGRYAKRNLWRWHRDKRDDDHESFGEPRWGRGKIALWIAVLCLSFATSLTGCELVHEAPNTSPAFYYGGIPPLGVTDEVLGNTGYKVGYSDTRADPLWVCYQVFAVPNPTPHARPSFKVDSRTIAKVSPDEYTNSGYDRGYMAPSATIDYCYGQEAQRETFYMSNVCPQAPALNRGIWAKLESDVRDWANAFGQVWVITGPIFGGDVERLPSGKVEIPTAFYKIIVDEEAGAPRVLSFVIPQEATSSTDLVSYLTSVDEIEAMTGFDFLSGLPDTTEDTLESGVPTALWDSMRAYTANSPVSAEDHGFMLARVDAAWDPP